MNSAERAEGVAGADDSSLPTLIGQALLLVAGGGVIEAALIGTQASADAFAARVLSAANQASQTYALQMSTLGTEIRQMNAATTPTPNVENRVEVFDPRYADGRPVVT